MVALCSVVLKLPIDHVVSLLYCKILDLVCGVGLGLCFVNLLFQFDFGFSSTKFALEDSSFLGFE